MARFNPCHGKTACRDDGVRCLTCGREASTRSTDCAMPSTALPSWRMVLCEKVVYGEVQLTHRYTYRPDGTLRRAEIADEDDGVRVLDFDLSGKRLA